jgi:hypothetical protein
MADQDHGFRQFHNYRSFFEAEGLLGADVPADFSFAVVIKSRMPFTIPVSAQPGCNLEESTSNV